MAGLGAGAGAFEGDQERARQAEARARINQQSRQFNASLQQRRDEAQQAAAERAQNREDTLNMRAEDRDWRQQESQRTQSNADRQFGLQAGGQEFNQQRAEKQDEWTQALNEQNMARQKQEMEFARERHKELTSKFAEEQNLIKQRKLFAQSTLASALVLTAQNGGNTPAVLLPELSKAVNAPVVAAYTDEETGNWILDVEVIENGQKRIVPNPFNPQAQAIMMRMLEDEGSMPKGAASSFENAITDKREHAQAMERDKARYDSYLQRSDARAESGAKLGEGAKAKIGVLTKRLAEAYEELDYASTPEEQAEWQSKIDRYSAEIDAIEGGGQASAGATSAGASRMSDIDRQALAWAKANPKDPRAEKIMKKLGGK